MIIAALYTQPRGIYYGLRNVEPWGPEKDARRYRGPHPVVAHPPCSRWGRYWWGGPTSSVRYELGADGGMFKAALKAVQRFGGVLEHPKDSHAWRYFGLDRPPRRGGWVRADQVGWTCCVDQGWYGHKASKATWLYAAHVKLPELMWGPRGKRLNMDGCTPEQRKRLIRTGVCQRLSRRQREATPPEFRDLLISIARTSWK